jgi:hypothetical protein
MPPPLVDTVPKQLKALFKDTTSLGLKTAWLPMLVVLTEEFRGIMVI